MPPLTTPKSSMTPYGQRTTPFGAVESPEVLEVVKTMSGVYRLDLLKALRNIWGANILRYRCQLYKLVSGTCSDVELRQYLKFFYLRYPAFGNFVTQAYYFGDQEKTLLQRIIEPARECVDNALKFYTADGCEVVGQHADYIYFVPTKDDAPIMRGAEPVC